MVGFLGSRVARRSSGPPLSSPWDYGGFPMYSCRDVYGRSLQRGGLVPLYLAPSIYEYPALPGSASDISLDGRSKKWNEVTLIYFVLGLIVFAILGKFTQDLLKSRKRRSTSRAQENSHLPSVDKVFYFEPESLVIIKPEGGKGSIISGAAKPTVVVIDPAGKSEAKKAEKPKEEKKEEKKVIKQEPKKEDNSKKNSKDESQSRPVNKQVALKVPMCCAECELTAAEALMTVPGVLDVECDHKNEKVTATVRGDIPAADLLLKCRSHKLFRKSDYWK